MGSPRVPPSPSARFWIAALILLGAAFLAFHGVLRLDFLEYDDNDYVLQNPRIYPLTAGKVGEMFVSPYFRSYTPVALLSHAVDFELWGKDPFGHHFTSLLAHLANTFLLFVVGVVIFTLAERRGGGNPRGLPEMVESAPIPLLLAAAGGAAFFSLHPLRVESVAWISDRKDLLMTTFVLLSILGYLLYAQDREAEGGRRWYRVAMASGLLAMLAKSVAVMLPLALLLIDATLLNRTSPRLTWVALIREKWWFFLCSLFTGVMSVLALVDVRRHPTLYVESTLEKIFLPFFTWAFYLWKSVLPTGLTPIYSYPPLWQQVLSMVVVVVAAAGAIWLHRRRRTAFPAAVLGFFLLFLLPTIVGRERAGIQPWADRYSYLPGVALGILFGGLLLWLQARGGWIRRAGVAVPAVVLLLFGTLSYLSVPHWKETETLFRHAVEVNPGAIFAQANLGLTLTSVGKPDEALEVLKRGVELSPTYAGSYGAMGLAYQAKGEESTAVRMYRRALELDSNFVDAHSNLGNALMALGRFDEAIAEYREAIRMEPEFDDAYYNMGIATYRKGDTAGAMDVFRRTAAVNPIRADTYVNMGIIFREWGKKDSAYIEFSRAASLGHAKAAELLRAWDVTQ